MKKSILFLFIPALLLLYSCKPSSGDLKDEKLGINFNYKNVSIGDFGYKIGERKLSTDEVPYGSDVTFWITGLKGLEEKNGKIILKVSIKVKDKEGKVLLEDGDLFKSDNDDGGVEAARVRHELALYFSTGSPLRVNQQYTAEFSVKDNSGKSEISGTYKIKTVPVEGSTYTENGLSSDGPVFIASPKEEVLTDNKPRNPEKITCYFHNFSGLVSEEGTVWPDAWVSVKDESGKLVYEFKDLFADYPDGVTEESVKDNMSVSITFGSEMKKGTKYTCEFGVKDKRGTGSLLSTYTFKW
jgi:hypothetical protein